MKRVPKLAVTKEDIRLSQIKVTDWSPVHPYVLFVAFLATLYFPLKRGINEASVVVVCVLVRKSKTVQITFRSFMYYMLALDTCKRALHSHKKVSSVVNVVLDCETCRLTSCIFMPVLCSGLVSVRDDA